MSRIARKVRKNIPETNSSSAHAIVICTDEIDSDVTHNLIDPNDPKVITININDYFGHEEEEYTSSLDKAAYCIALSRGNAKLMKRIEKVIFSFTGAERLIVNTPNWIGPFDTMVDHQSSDLIDQICESIESIRQFIFHPKSAVRTASDGNCEYSEGVKDLYATPHLGDYVAKITIGSLELDFPLEKFPYEHVIAEILQSENYNYILSNIWAKVIDGKIISIVTNEPINGIDDYYVIDTDVWYGNSPQYHILSYRRETPATLRLTKIEDLTTWKNVTKGIDLDTFSKLVDTIPELERLGKLNVINIPIKIVSNIYGTIE